MAEEDGIVLVEQPVDHARTLAQLSSKISGDQCGSPASRSSNLQCPRVPRKLLQDVNPEDYEVPKRISLGPYHHGNPALVGGETLKLKLAGGFILWSGCKVKDIYNPICNRVHELKDCYEEETAEKFKDDEFTEMMLVDGCALLWYIICGCLGLGHEDYDIRYQDLSLLHQDALLLENQLPYQLLQLLMPLFSDKLSYDSWTIIFQELFGTIEESYFQEIFGIKEKPFLQRMKDYCRQPSLPVIRCIAGRNPDPEREGELQPTSEEELEPNSEEGLQPKPDEKSKPNSEEGLQPHHLLDFYHRNFLGRDKQSDPTRTEKVNSGKGSQKKTGISKEDIKEQHMASFRNVKELMAAGIRIKRSPTRFLTDITFTPHFVTADLRLPRITIDKSTRTLFFNLIAYEMSSDVPHDFISYLRFLDSLIDHADDVKELQSAGVLQNNLGTIEEVAEFFNTVSAKLDSNFLAYRDVRVKIRKHVDSHYNSKLKMWTAQFLDNYFDSPWTIIAWIAAALALFLTAVQTYFSAFSR